MIAATFESSGIAASRSGTPSDVARCVVVDVELAELHLAVREYVGLPRGRDAEDAADRVGGLELGGDDEVDVELALAPELDVLDARRADHGRRALGLASGEHSGDEVHLVARRAGDDEVGGRRCLRPRDPCGSSASPSKTATSKRRRQRLEPRRLRVEHGDLVLVVEGLHDGRADLPRPDDEDPHERVAYCRSRRAYSRWLPWPRAARPVLAAAVSVIALATVSGSAFGAESAFRKAVFARGFDAPVLLTYAPGEPRTVYVVEQPGRVIRLRAGRRTVFLDIRNRVEYGGEQGLLGLAFDPGYASNRRFYVAFTSRTGRNTVERFRSERREGRAVEPQAPSGRAGSVREPQRRPPRVRSGRSSLHEHRRRWFRR